MRDFIVAFKCPHAERALQAPTLTFLLESQETEMDRGKTNSTASTSKSATKIIFGHTGVQCW